jgi:hypothetical protein
LAVLERCPCGRDESLIEKINEYWAVNNAAKIKDYVF